MKVAEFIKRYEQRHRTDGEVVDGSTRSAARQRAGHPTTMHSGTVHDWEDLERYRAEFERLTQEGPQRTSTK